MVGNNNVTGLVLHYQSKIFQPRKMLSTRKIDTPSKLSQGTIELCWFAPQGHKDEKIQDLMNTV